MKKVLSSTHETGPVHDGRTCRLLVAACADVPADATNDTAPAATASATAAINNSRRTIRRTLPRRTASVTLAKTPTRKLITA